MVQYVEPSVTSRVWPGCIVMVLPFWLSPAWISLEGDPCPCPCHGSAQLARHMQRTQHAAITAARGQKALMNIPLLIARISLVSPSYRPYIARETRWPILTRTCAIVRTRQTLLDGNKFQQPGLLA